MTEQVETFALVNPASSLPSFDDAAPQQAYLEVATCPFATPTGKQVLGRRADVVQFTRHPAVKASDGVHLTMGAKAPLIPLHLDGPEHRHYRALLEPLFSPKAVSGLEPAVRALVDGLVDTFIADGHVELYGTFCEALPSAIFVELLGLSPADLPEFVKFKHAVVRPEGSTLEEMMAYADQAAQNMYAHLNRIFDEREASGNTDGDDLISGLYSTTVDGKKLSRDEMLNIVFLLVIAGLDTVASSLSCIFAWLAAHPTERAALVADPSGWPRAVEEFLRFESPVIYGSRYVTEDFAINDLHFKSGEWVDVVWAAANMDPEAFQDPLTVDLTRARNAHLDFASGPHRCLGSNLARMELITILEQFHRRIPDYRVTEGEELVWTAVGVRMVSPLPLSFVVPPNEVP